MGMAASQARLLTITARMHDVEYQAQSIQNAKIELATQSDAVYQDYLDALDATTLTIKDWQGNVVTANFNNLCGINAVDSSYKYALMDEKGRLIVSNEVARGYQEYMKNAGSGADAYGFAYFMLGEDTEKAPDYKDDTNGKTSFANLYALAIEAFTKKINNNYNSKLFTFNSVEPLDEKTENTSALKTIDNKNTDYLKELYEQLTKIDIKVDGTENAESNPELDAMREKYLYQLNKQFSAEIFEYICNNSKKSNIAEYFDEADFNYYVSMFKQIQEKGGSCVSIADISSFDGFDGDAANDSEWLKKMIQAGKITVEHVNTNQKNGKVSFSSTGVPSDSVLEYTTTTTIDKTALAKAEAEYEHKTKELDRKDKKFDLELSKLDTQRTALKTEYDSVKKVIEENIDRTFGIFS